jgi:hypothetical protein
VLPIVTELSPWRGCRDGGVWSSGFCGDVRWCRSPERGKIAATARRHCPNCAVSNVAPRSLFTAGGRSPGYRRRDGGGVSTSPERVSPGQGGPGTSARRVDRGSSGNEVRRPATCRRRAADRSPVICVVARLRRPADLPASSPPATPGSLSSRPSTVGAARRSAVAHGCDRRRRLGLRPRFASTSSTHRCRRSADRGCSPSSCGEVGRPRHRCDAVGWRRRRRPTSR